MCDVSNVLCDSGVLSVKNGASVEARDKKGWTPLFHATYSGHQNMVQLLVAHGADVNAVYVLLLLLRSRSKVKLYYSVL